MKFQYLVLATVWVSIVGVALGAGECAQLAGGAPCPEGFCCSNAGYCGTGADWCDADHCQSQCWAPTPPPPPPAPTPPAPPSPLSDIIDIYLFDELLKHRNDSVCGSPGFITYYAFITAASFYPDFGTTGDTETRKREIAAFLARTSHETTGGWDTAPDGRYTWGYCFLVERNPGSDYCVESQEWPCVPGKSYQGRGPIQLSYNYNYGPCGRDIGYNLLNDPDALANDAVLSFRSALWFWMTAQAPKPSCHDVITGQWTPTPADVAANRLPGYGVTTNIINGGIECGWGNNQTNAQQADRIGFYGKYCDDFGVSYGDNVDCYDQQPFGWGVGLVKDI